LLVDASLFDRFTVAIAQRTTRRAALALLSAIGFGTLLVEEAQAVCIENGKRCDPNAVPNGCCSGRCPRKKKRCRPAFKQDSCTVEDNFCTDTGNFECGSTTIPCLCRLTIDGQSFCSQSNDAVDCTTHQECEQRLGKGSRCCPLGDRCSGGGAGNECATKCPNVK
jgi:hypothetical protein